MYCTDIDQDFDPSNPSSRSRQCIKQYDEIRSNFWIANYHANRGAVDNDDGSAYYSTHDNFFVYSDGGLKNDFGGHDNHHVRNVYAYTGKALNVCPALEGHEDWFFENKVIPNPRAQLALRSQSM